MSASKDKGTRAESALVTYLRVQGFTQVERRATSGAKDRGDIAGIPSVVIEAKDQASMKLAEWLKEAHVERDNDGAEIGVVWHKKRGKGSPKDWYVTMDGATFATLLRHYTGVEAPEVGA